jgi:hypothetical protein
MEYEVRREVKSTTRRAGLLRKSLTQVAVLGLVCSGALVAISASVGADEATANCNDTLDPEEYSLEVCKDGPATADAGTDITYMISPSTEHNDGEGVDSDEDLSVIDELPAGMTVVAIDGGSGEGAWDCGNSTSTVVDCYLSLVEPDDEKVSPEVDPIYVTVHIDSGVAGTLENCATLTFIEEPGTEVEETVDVTACFDTEVTAVPAEVTTVPAPPIAQPAPPVKAAARFTG